MLLYAFSSPVMWSSLARTTSLIHLYFDYDNIHHFHQLRKNLSKIACFKHFHCRSLDSTFITWARAFEFTSKNKNYSCSFEIQMTKFVVLIPVFLLQPPLIYLFSMILDQWNLFKKQYCCSDFSASYCHSQKCISVEGSMNSLCSQHCKKLRCLGSVIHQPTNQGSLP